MRFEPLTCTLDNSWQVGGIERFLSARNESHMPMYGVTGIEQFFDITVVASQKSSRAALLSGGTSTGRMALFKLQIAILGCLQARSRRLFFFAPLSGKVLRNAIQS